MGDALAEGFTPVYVLFRSFSAPPPPSINPCLLKKRQISPLSLCQCGNSAGAVGGAAAGFTVDGWTLAKRHHKNYSPPHFPRVDPGALILMFREQADAPAGERRNNGDKSRHEWGRKRASEQNGDVDFYHDAKVN